MVGVVVVVGVVVGVVVVVVVAVGVAVGVAVAVGVVVVVGVAVVVAVAVVVKTLTDNTMKEIIKDGFYLMGAMIWTMLGFMCAFSPFLLGGVGNSKNPELETGIGIALIVMAPFWVVITKRIIEKMNPENR